ncbi:hypothetical protein HHK36_011010 [Tetracentron sinense]|uniref:Plant-specific domain TIGR01615 family protein n=1 Tax=Tetracentron sinense TaxID=13715 RepID=A0A835DFU9_TETSI|nr:hypothetical protein HHK36_011010 [Tetracentron sinense]
MSVLVLSNTYTGSCVSNTGKDGLTAAGLAEAISAGASRRTGDGPREDESCPPPCTSGSSPGEISKPTASERVASKQGEARPEKEENQNSKSSVRRNSGRVTGCKDSSEEEVPVKLGTWGFERRAVVAPAEGEDLNGGGMNCHICAVAGDLLVRLAGGGGQFVGPIGGFSHESEHDLAVMVSDFLENGSGGADSRCSSDSDSGFSDLAHLSEKILYNGIAAIGIWNLDALPLERVHLVTVLVYLSTWFYDYATIYQVLALSAFGFWIWDGSAFCVCLRLNDFLQFYKHKMDSYESDLLSMVHSLILSINETDLRSIKSGPCNASCIRFSLVKLLRSSGYDAAVCASKWQSCGKVPGGDHEYIDVVTHNPGCPERLIIDIDFRSHFEIARAVKSYDAILNSLPVVYVGSLPKLKQFLQVMVEAARSSLKQNSMPLPPWRSLAYLKAKWHSAYQRMPHQDGMSINGTSSSAHRQCIGHLRRLKSSLQCEMGVERLLKPINNDNNRRLKLERPRHSSFRAL